MKSGGDGYLRLFLAYVISGAASSFLASFVLINICASVMDYQFKVFCLHTLALL